MIFEFQNILEYIRTIFSGTTWLYLDTTDSELLLKTTKTKVAKLQFFKQINTNDRIAICLPALHYSVDFILLSFGIMGFIVELLKL